MSVKEIRHYRQLEILEGSLTLPGEYACFAIMERFWNKVIKTKDCWFWRGATQKGYGCLVKENGKRKNGKRFQLKISAHRISYQLHYGEIPLDLHVLHRCDIRNCVNPEHLFLGTNADNMADKIKKGRQAGGSMPGSKNPNSKINEQDIKKIRHLYKNKAASQRQLQSLFNLSRGSIYKIVHRLSWDHV